MAEQARAAAGDSTPSPLIRIERGAATFQIVFGEVVDELPYERFGLRVVAAIPRGREREVVLEGPATAFLELGVWAFVEGRVRKAALRGVHRRIGQRLRDEGVQIEVPLPPASQLPAGQKNRPRVLWGPEAVRLIRDREPYGIQLLGRKRRVAFGTVIEEIEKGGVLFYFDPSYSVLKTVEMGYIELSFTRPKPKRSVMIAVDLDEDEARLLLQWAKFLGLARPEVIRQLVVGLPSSTRGGRVAFAAGGFGKVSAGDRSRLDELLEQREKETRALAKAQAAAAKREMHRAQRFVRALEEVGRGRAKLAIEIMEEALGDVKPRGRRRSRGEDGEGAEGGRARDGGGAAPD